MKGTIVAVSLSERKGTRKHQVDEARLVEDWGLDGDAHAGKWHRQVSLLSTSSFEKARGWGSNVVFGDFAENLAVSGIDVYKLPIGTKLQVGQEAVVEITQIGKKCHVGCEISKLVGRCIMPLEGVFARVLTGGSVRNGDTVLIVEPDAAAGPSATVERASPPLSSLSQA